MGHRDEQVAGAQVAPQGPHDRRVDSPDPQGVGQGYLVAARTRGKGSPPGVHEANAALVVMPPHDDGGLEQAAVLGDAVSAQHSPLGTQPLLGVLALDDARLYLLVGAVPVLVPEHRHGIVVEPTCERREVRDHEDVRVEVDRRAMIGKEQVGTLDADNWLIMKVSGLDEATVYYARMFVKYDDKDPDTEDYKYGALISFKTLTFKSAEAVDMGLPSGTEWSSVNVGAENPEDYGGCYSWAETEPKSIAIPTTYKWSKNGQLTKYCNDSSKGYNQLSDGKTEMDPEDDAAQRWMGGNWRVSTAKQMEELMSSSNCKWEIKSRNGVQGILITSLANGNTLFFPIMGGLDRPVWYPQGYYTASLNPGSTEIAYGISTTTGDDRAAILCGYDRWNRMLLRPVTQ